MARRAGSDIISVCGETRGKTAVGGAPFIVINCNLSGRQGGVFLCVSGGESESLNQLLIQRLWFTVGLWWRPRICLRFPAKKTLLPSPTHTPVHLPLLLFDPSSHSTYTLLFSPWASFNQSWPLTPQPCWLKRPAEATEFSPSPSPLTSLWLEEDEGRVRLQEQERERKAGFSVSPHYSFRSTKPAVFLLLLASTSAPWKWHLYNGFWY